MLKYFNKFQCANTQHPHPSLALPVVTAFREKCLISPHTAKWIDDRKTGVKDRQGQNHLGYSPIMLELMKGVWDNPSWDTNRLSLK